MTNCKVRWLGCYLSIRRGYFLFLISVLPVINACSGDQDGIDLKQVQEIIELKIAAMEADSLHEIGGDRIISPQNLIKFYGNRQFNPAWIHRHGFVNSSIRYLMLCMLPERRDLIRQTIILKNYWALMLIWILTLKGKVWKICISMK